MSDQCRHCKCYQNYDECVSTPYFHHEDWIDVERIKHIKELEDTIVRQAANLMEIRKGRMPDFKEWWNKNSHNILNRARGLKIFKEFFNKCWTDAQLSITQPKLSDKEIDKLGEALDKMEDE
jgi:hypothetical protein